MGAARYFVAAALLAAATVSGFDAGACEKVASIDSGQATGPIFFDLQLPIEPRETALDKLLLERSDPKSATFGRWLSVADILSLTAPRKGLKEELASHLRERGVTCDKEGLDKRPHMMRCKAESLATLQSLTKLELESYLCEGSVTVGGVAPSSSGALLEVEGLPEGLRSTVAGISGLSLQDRLLQELVKRPDLLKTRQQEEAQGRRLAFQQAAGAGASSASFLVTSTIETIKRQYNWPTNPRVNASTTVHLTAQFASPAIAIEALAWEAFLQQNSITTKNVLGFSMTLGYPAASSSSATSSRPEPDSVASAYLPVEWMSGLAAGNGNGIYTAAGPVTTGLVPFLQDVLALAVAGSPLPSVILITSNAPEADFGDAAITQANSALKSLGLLGVTIVVASGDRGANAAGSAQCSDSGGAGGGGGRLTASFPASSPWVLSVGATAPTFPTPILPNPSSVGCIQPPLAKMRCAGIFGEIAASVETGSLITSGGGFSASAVQPMPAWQQAAVTGYLNSTAGLAAPANLFNPSNRAYPDVSANGIACLGWAPLVASGTTGKTNGGAFVMDSTACAASVWASAISLLASARTAAGKPALGFLNPQLYSLYSSVSGLRRIFRDVTRGSNNCLMASPSTIQLSTGGNMATLNQADISALCPQSCSGFQAGPGFDPVTGLGTVDFSDLIAALTAFPSAWIATTPTPSAGPAAYLADTGGSGAIAAAQFSPLAVVLALLVAALVSSALPLLA